MKKKRLATLVPLLLAILVFSTLFAVTNGQDLRGQLRMKTDKIDKKFPEKDDPPADPGTENTIFQIDPRLIPRCKRTPIHPVSNTNEHYYNNDHVMDIGLTAFENEMMNLGAWNDVLDMALESSTVDNIDLVSANFANNNADWIFTGWSADVFDDNTGNLTEFSPSFLSEQDVRFSAQSTFTLTADIFLSNGNDYRITLEVPEINVRLHYFADVFGTFDFKEATINNQTYLLGNTKEIFKKTDPVVDTNFQGYDFEELYMTFGNGFEVVSIMAVNNEGETSEPTDLITVTILENLLESNNLSEGGVFLGLHEGMGNGYIGRILTDAQIETVLEAFKDALGITMGRQLEDDYGYVTNHDLLQAHWIEDGTPYEKALICDYGQSVSTTGTVHPTSVKPGVPYVENGVDHNF